MLAAAADASARASALSLEPYERSLLDRTIESAKLALTENDFDSAWKTGLALSLEEAAARAGDHMPIEWYPAST